MKTIMLLRFQIIVAVFVSIALLTIPQLREVLRIHVESGPDFSALCAIVSLTLLSTVIWNTGRILTILRAAPKIDENPETQLSLTERWLPRLCGWLVIAAAGTAMIWMGIQTESANVRTTMIWTGVLALFFSIAFLYVVTRRTKWTGVGYAAQHIPFRRLTAFFLLVYVGIVIATLSLPITFPQQVGVLALSFIFAALLVHILTGAQIALRMREVPVLTILLLWAALLSWFDWNDNHHLALEGPNTPCDPHNCKLPAADEAFADWVEAREADIKRYQDGGKPYPVFIVAAHGGGIYASYHTATFLARLQDTCPAFARHVFAISGVSGGSVGAAVWSDLLSEGVPNAAKPVSPGLENKCDINASPTRGLYETAAHDIFTTDLLSPVVAKMLYGETLQAVLPRFPGFSRNFQHFQHC